MTLTTLIQRAQERFPSLVSRLLGQNHVIVSRPQGLGGNLRFEDETCVPTLLVPLCWLFTSFPIIHVIYEHRGKQGIQKTRKEASLPP